MSKVICGQVLRTLFWTLKRTVDIHFILIHIKFYRLTSCRSSMIATPHASRTDLSTMQVNLSVSKEAKKELLERGDDFFDMVEEVV